jgi:hypothetical protein
MQSSQTIRDLGGHSTKSNGENGTVEVPQENTEAVTGMANRPQCNSNARYSALYCCIVDLAGYVPVGNRDLNSPPLLIPVRALISKSYAFF